MEAARVPNWGDSFDDPWLGDAETGSRFSMHLTNHKGMVSPTD